MPARVCARRVVHARRSVVVERAYVHPERPCPDVADHRRVGSAAASRSSSAARCARPLERHHPTRAARAAEARRRRPRLASARPRRASPGARRSRPRPRACAACALERSPGVARSMASAGNLARRARRIDVRGQRRLEGRERQLVDPQGPRQRIALERGRPSACGPATSPACGAPSSLSPVNVTTSRRRSNFLAPSARVRGRAARGRRARRCRGPRPAARVAACASCASSSSVGPLGEADDAEVARVDAQDRRRRRRGVERAR